MNITFTFLQSLALFGVSALCIWYFCNKLSDIVDFIDDRFNLGSAFGGTIILSVLTNLPEIAITINASIKGNIDLAVGNILGGILVQSVLLVVFDFAGKKNTPLSTLTNSESSKLQGLFLVVILTFVIIGKQLSPGLIFGRTTPPEIAILLTWLLSIIALRKFQKGDKHTNAAKNSPHTKLTKKSAVAWLVVIGVIVLVFGTLLEITSDTIAAHLNINGVIFGATFLALVTSLPEISGGLAFVRAKTYQPIISDIFGGNAFLPVLFIPATIISNKPVLPALNNVDIYLTSSAIIVTAIYVTGIIISPKNKKLGLGYDSWLCLLLYILSVIGMFYLG